MKRHFLLSVIFTIATSITGQAAISIHFEQIGFDVVATTYGSVTIPSHVHRVHNDSNIGGGFFGTATALYAGNIQIIADSYNGVPIPTPLALAPSSTSFEVFGFLHNRIYIEDETLEPLSTYAPTGTITWNNTDIATVFGGTVPAEKVIRAFELPNFVSGSNTNYIQYVIIPEPSSILLLGLGALGFAVSRWIGNLFSRGRRSPYSRKVTV